jgi:hypothetical protein
VDTNGNAPAGGNGGGPVETSSAIGPDNKTPPAHTQAARRTVPPAARREYILSELRLAVALTDVERNHLTTLGVALKAGLITDEWALAELRQSPFFRPLVDGGIV